MFLVVALFAAAYLAPLASAARLELPVIVVDLAHGQQYNGVCAMMQVVPDAYWIIIVKSKDMIQQLPNCIKTRVYEIVAGDLTYLGSGPTVDMVIIGQPVEPLSKAEKDAIVGWFKGSGAKALWCATDSDYPAQGGNMELAQHICNDLLDYMQQNGIDVKLRSDYVSVEDTKSNAGRSYRVIGLVEPPKRYDADLLALGAEKVLMHGPGAVAWVDKDGNWHKVIDPKTGKQTAPEDIVPIIVTTDGGRIVEHQPKKPGEPGELGYAHQAGEQGKFCLMAAQIMDLKGRKVVIVSGESPYFGYQSLVTYQYHGKLLDGPRFFRNLVLWATADFADLKAAKQLLGQAQQAASAAAQKESQKIAESLQSKLQSLENQINSIKSQVDTLSKKVDNLASQLQNVQKIAVQQAQQQVAQVSSKANNAYTYAIGGLVLAVIALIAAGLALQRRS